MAAPPCGSPTVCQGGVKTLLSLRGSEIRLRLKLGPLESPMKPSARHPLVCIAALAWTLSSSAALAWPPGGVAVAPLPNAPQDEPRLLAGRDGAVFAYWSDGRWLEPYSDLYGQLLDRAGNVAPAWPDTGLMLDRAFDNQGPAAGLTHPDGSFIVGIEWSIAARTYQNFLPRIRAVTVKSTLVVLKNLLQLLFSLREGLNLLVS